MKIEPKYGRVYRDAHDAPAPEDRPEGHGRRADAGHARGRAAARRADASRSRRRCPDVNLDEILAALDADTRDYLHAAAQRRRRRRCGGNGGTLADGDPADRAHRARSPRRINKALATRRTNMRARDPQLLAGHRGARRQGRPGRRLRGRAPTPSSRRSPARTPTCAPRCASCRPRCGATQTDARQGRRGSPTSSARRCRTCGPSARALGPTLRAVRPFLRETTPIIRDELRPFTRAALPTVQRAAPGDARPGRPRRPTSRPRSRVINYLLNELAYNPPGAREEGYLFWFAWANHLGTTLFATQDAHGPIRRGLVVFGCSTASASSTRWRPSQPAAGHAGRPAQRPEPHGHLPERPRRGPGARDG